MKLSPSRIRKPIVKPFAGRKWAALGTSITSDADDSYVPVLESLTGMTCTNLGVVGASVSSSSSYVGGGFASQITSIPLDSQVVTIECGANDFRGNATLGSMSDLMSGVTGGSVGLTTFYRALYTTIHNVLNQDWTRTVIVFGMYPNSPADSYQSANYTAANNNGNYYWEFEKAIRDVCSYLNVPYVPALGVGGPTQAAFMDDGVHLSTAGKYKYANAIHAQLKNFKPVTQTWSLSTVAANALSGNRLSSITIDGSNVVQYTAPNTGNASTDSAVLWIATGSNNACEFEIAEPAKGLYICYGEHSDPSQGWQGVGDPGYDSGPFNYLFAFSSSGLLYLSGLRPTSNNPGAYATKYRVARLNKAVYCQGWYSNTWKTVFNIDLAQQAVAVPAASHAVPKLGIYVNGTIYTKVKNVKAGMLELT